MPTNRDYKLPKALLCEQSPYFKAMFDGNFQESREQRACLTEDDVVSIQNFDLLVQYLYIGRINLEEFKPEDKITAIVGFARIADMCGLTGMESSLADQIEDVITLTSYIDMHASMAYRDPNLNLKWVTAHHIKSACRLPNSHAVRIILAKAAVEGYLRGKDFKFGQEIEDAPGFAADLLKAVKKTFNTGVVVSHMQNGLTEVSFEEPITQNKLPLDEIPR
jgi:hypothetical protein